MPAAGHKALDQFGGQDTSSDVENLNMIHRLETLQSKLAAGQQLTAEEYTQLDADSKSFEALRTGSPETFDRLVGFINNTRQSAGKTTGLNTDGLSSFVDSFSQRTNTQQKSNSQTKQTTVQYVDVPTPEEFLDDFTNAYNIHLTGLVSSGALSPEAADFARSMQTQIFGEYLRQQTANLLKGEPIYKVVGTNAENKLIGARTGVQSDTQTQQEQTQNTQYARTDSAAGGPVSAAAAQSPAGQAVSQAGSSTGSFQDTTQSEDQSKVNQTEAEVQRNRLTYVNSLAPLDFFKDQATAQRLNFLYQGMKGQQTRERQTATGREATSARRI